MTGTAIAKSRKRNGREHQIQMWLDGRPEDARKAVLLLNYDEAVHMVGSWSNTDVDSVPDLPEHILDVAQGTVDEIGRTLLGSLRWLNAEGEPFEHEKTLRISPTDPTHVEFEGSNLDQARQAQKHLEAMTRVFVGSLNDMTQTMQTAMSAQSEMLDRIANRLGAAEQREADAKGVIAKLEADLMATRNELTMSEDGAADERTERLLQLAEKCATPYLMKMAAGNTKKN